MALKLASMRVRVYWLIYAKNSISYELLLISNYAGINATQAAQNKGSVEQIKNDETTRATMQSLQRSCLGKTSPFLFERPIARILQAQRYESLM